ncbi:SDR family oxidoreductase [Acinetobacter nectaris]|uniref:SDR family oxidoreductase n=1 Tax=Acinetobacter nectaris TaxID=1219382 RepID=UPI001F332110|nr:SDR family oxidoreductase [Acinetobacter nectaris]MCF9046969.1 SDR family oxidoreductase [Acinetobacter nectaris]
MFDLSNKLALVTGSSRGLGNTLAGALASAGARVILHGRDSKSLDSAAIEWEKSHGIRPDTVFFDVQDAAGVEAAVKDLIEKFGTPDILVNNAGIQRRAPFAEFSISDWDDIIATNLSSVFYVSRFIVPHMIHRGSGKIINIASVQSELGRQTIAPYAASKGGVALLTRGMTADLARHNIQVNTLSPGYFATDMNSALVADKNFTTWLEQRTPAGRWGRPEELAGALVFLASSASDFITGQNLFVDGGMTAVV